MYFEELNFYVRDEDIISKEPISLGIRLKSILKDKKMTQKELANITGIAEKTISKWIKEKAKPNKDSLSLISEALNVNIDYLSCNPTSKDLIKSNYSNYRDYRWSFFDQYLKIMEAFGYEIELIETIEIPNEQKEEIIRFSNDPYDFEVYTVDEPQLYTIEEFIIDGYIYKFKHYSNIQKKLEKAIVKYNGIKKKIEYEMTYDELLNFFVKISDIENEIHKRLREYHDDLSYDIKF